MTFTVGWDEAAIALAATTPATPTTRAAAAPCADRIVSASPSSFSEDGVSQVYGAPRSGFRRRLRRAPRRAARRAPPSWWRRARASDPAHTMAVAMFFVVERRSGPDWEPSRPLDSRAAGTPTLRSWTDSSTRASSCSVARWRTSIASILAVEAESADECARRSPATRGAARTSWSRPSSRGRSGSTAGPLAIFAIRSARTTRRPDLLAERALEGGHSSAAVSHAGPRPWQRQSRPVRRTPRVAAVRPTVAPLAGRHSPVPTACGTAETRPGRREPYG